MAPRHLEMALVDWHTHKVVICGAFHETFCAYHDRGGVARARFCTHGLLETSRSDVTSGAGETSGYQYTRPWGTCADSLGAPPANDLPDASGGTEMAR